MEPDKHYHLYTHANGFENLFRSEENYRYFLQRYQYFIPEVADTLAYCLMPNHIHFLVRIKTKIEIETSKVSKNLGGLDGEGSKNLGGFDRIEKRISQQFSNLFNSYTKAFNKMYSRKGSLFIPNFKRKEITTDQQFTNIIFYIHANPVHHGFVKNINSWPWSSYPILLEEAPTFIKRDEVLAWFGNRNEFEKFHQQPIDLKMKSEAEF